MGSKWKIGITKIEFIYAKVPFLWVVYTAFFYWKKQRKKKYFLLFNCSNQRYQNKYIDLKPNPTIQLAHLSKPTKIAWEIHFIRKYKIATQIGMLLNAPLKKENDICRSGGQGEASSPCIYFRRSQQQLRITTAMVTTDHRCTCYAKTKKTWLHACGTCVAQ